MATKIINPKKTKEIIDSLKGISMHDAKKILFQCVYELEEKLKQVKI